MHYVSSLGINQETEGFNTMSRGVDKGGGHGTSVVIMLSFPWRQLVEKWECQMVQSPTSNHLGDMQYLADKPEVVNLQ